MMDPEVKAKWVTALRSGNYVQGKQCLRDVHGRYCCLGVLAHEMAFFGQNRGDPGEALSIVKDSSALFGPAQNTALKLSESDQWKLIGMNDNGRPFSEIADWIEANL